MNAKLQQVHVRVNDAATGKPTPCRVRFTDAEGNYYAPHGRTPEMPLNSLPWTYRGVGGTCVEGLQQWAYIDGACEIDLPAGALTVAIEKGPEYERLRQDIQLPEGKLSLRFALNRVINLERDGWYAGEIVAKRFSPHEVLLSGAAHGLRVIDLLAHERETTEEGLERMRYSSSLRFHDASAVHTLQNGKPRATIIDYPNLIAFSGQRPCVETPDCVVVVNTFNRHQDLGALYLLNCHRVVYPLRFGHSAFDNSAYHKPDNWTLSDWCDQCHRKGGLVIGVDWRWSLDASDPWYGGEGLANIIRGKVDAVVGDSGDEWWCKLLSVGIKVPIVAGHQLSPARTYGRVDEGQQFSYAHWIDAIRKGRTVVSSGPFLTMTVNGAGPGAQIEVAGHDRKMTVRAVAMARDSFDQIEIVHNGVVVLAQSAREEVLWTAEISREIAVTESGWVAARCTTKSLLDDPDSIMAHTSPIYIRLNDQPPPVDARVIQELVACADGMLAWVAHKARCDTPEDRQRLARVFLEARQALLEKLKH